MDTGPALQPTPRYRQVVEAAAEMAKDLGHEYIGTEHLFLAILADPDAVPTQVMAELIEPAVVVARVRECGGTLLTGIDYLTPLQLIDMSPADRSAYAKIT